MEAACAKVITITVLLNCIWHFGYQNLNRNLHDALGKDWETFISLFWITRNDITEQDFERRFTAGIQSTQRIESVNTAVKRAVNSKTPLPSQFRSIEHMISNESRTSRWMRHKMDTTHDPTQSVFVKQMFSDIIDENNRYLGILANSHMKMEMMRSVYYHSSLYEPELIHKYATEY
ncbi:hypothetical protein BG015_006649 [Linnemannia schmuckeri]|uniref:Uncharacterized protein n=1 Tax=Linnemannia schmuckeri TaxID=64567 RepID=A0A9P5VBV1_9FUNG|nr:hypothetical protein BG015_006649 [Linnemannia schmuckeri]